MKTKMFLHLFADSLNFEASAKTVLLKNLDADVEIIVQLDANLSFESCTFLNDATGAFSWGGAELAEFIAWAESRAKRGLLINWEPMEAEGAIWIRAYLNGVRLEPFQISWDSGTAEESVDLAIDFWKSTSTSRTCGALIGEIRRHLAKDIGYRICKTRTEVGGIAA